MTGMVYLVGSGPGGTGLLTLRAREVIDSAEVILYDQLPGEEILNSLPASAEKIDCGKYGSDHTLEQDEIEELMVARAQAGKRVVRLKGGDPFVFGRGGEELEVLIAHGIPGRSSAGRHERRCGSCRGRHPAYSPEICLPGDYPHRPRGPEKSRDCTGLGTPCKRKGNDCNPDGSEKSPQYCRFAAHSRKKS